MRKTLLRLAAAGLLLGHSPAFSGPRSDSRTAIIDLAGHDAEICDEIASQLKRGTRLETAKVHDSIKKATAKFREEDFHPVNAAIDAADHNGYLDQSAADLFEQLAVGYREAGGSGGIPDMGNIGTLFQGVGIATVIFLVGVVGALIKRRAGIDDALRWPKYLFAFILEKTDKATAVPGQAPQVGQSPQGAGTAGPVAPAPPAAPAVLLPTSIVPAPPAAKVPPAAPTAAIPRVPAK
jgi:hypothetical protein